jgi:hypothetical protein
MSPVGNLHSLDHVAEAICSADCLAILYDPVQLMLGRGRFRERSLPQRRQRKPIADTIITDLEGCTAAFER